MQQKSIRAVQASSYGGRGFTLIEVIIAMFILTVALLSLVSVTIMVIKGNSFSKEMTTATTLARDKLEQIKNMSYITVTSGTTSDYKNLDSTDGTAGAFYTRTLVVTDSTPAANMKTITVTVSWNWGVMPRSVTLSTIIAA